MEGWTCDPLSVVSCTQRVEEILLVLILWVANQRHECEFPDRRSVTTSNELDSCPYGDRRERIENLLKRKGTPLTGCCCRRATVVLYSQSSRRNLHRSAIALSGAVGVERLAIFAVQIFKWELKCFEAGRSTCKCNRTQIIHFVCVGRRRRLLMLLLLLFCCVATTTNRRSMRRGLL